MSTLLKFVTIGENEPTRRRVRRSTLTEAQRRVAEAFIAARLLTSDGDGDEAILEVAHEALFRSWAPLQQAIEASTDQLRWRADLERWAKDWESSGRQDAYLLRDERFKTAQRWAASDGAVADGLALVAEFLACSNRADEATMQRLSETIARQALGTVDRDPDYSLLLALAAWHLRLVSRRDDPSHRLVKTGTKGDRGGRSDKFTAIRVLHLRRVHRGTRRAPGGHRCVVGAWSARLQLSVSLLPQGHQRSPGAESVIDGFDQLGGGKTPRGPFSE